MSLGPCPECKKSISHRARTCPECGYPFEDYGSFGGYLVAMREEQIRRKLAEKRLRQQRLFRTITFFIIILLILAVLILLWYATQHSSFGATNPIHVGSTPSASTATQTSSSPSPVSTVSTVVATSAAETTIQQYYDDVNSQNYQAAYTMWASQQESLAKFQSGYSNTRQDILTFGDTVSQTDGSTKVLVTVVATELTSSGGTVQSTYKGYYIVGQRGGEWKILDGTLSLA